MPTNWTKYDLFYIFESFNATNASARYGTYFNYTVNTTYFYECIPNYAYYNLYNYSIYLIPTIFLMFIFVN